MTTKHSPLPVLQRQAASMASTLKAAERGGAVSTQFTWKMQAARLEVGIVMDDKVIRLTLPWDVISGTPEAGLAEYIVRLMREEQALQS